MSNQQYTSKPPQKSALLDEAIAHLTGKPATARSRTIAMIIIAFIGFIVVVAITVPMPTN